MYWNMANDGGTAWFPNGTTETPLFAAGFNNFLNVRHDRGRK